MRTLLSRFLFASLLVAVGSGMAMAEEYRFDLTARAGDFDREDTPVRVVIDVPESLADGDVTLTDPTGAEFPAQLSRPSVLETADSSRKPQVGMELRELAFVLRELAAGETAEFRGVVTKKQKADAGAFQWRDKADQYMELRHGDRPVLRYMYEALDDSTPEDRERTYKVYHHLFDPTGETILTKGPGGKFTHHRGLFFGFNRITYGDNVKVDTWHCRGDAHLAHEGLVADSVGPVLGRHVVGVAWNGQGKETFARETRELTAYDVPGGQLIEFATVLGSTGGKVRLDGDPQHAGFQFRASNEVAEGDQKLTYYLRPDGKGGPGETRNWSSGNDQCADLPWNAMSFVVGGQRYTAVYLDKPTNPKEARYSERTYGRFGSYFEYDLDKQNPLRLNYRVWVQPGEMTVEEAQALWNDFNHPVEVEVVAASMAEAETEASAEINVPPEGFVALFNGKDLTGWKGLVANPPKRAAMAPEELAAAQEKADQTMRDHWSAQDGVLVFDGEAGGANICTAKDYADFELLVDWKIGPKADSGIYLRGSPQVQIWDPADRGIGSGGLYNNKIGESDPLVIADNPPGEWNTFRIKMVGENVSVWLNDTLVVDDVVMENYWERDKPIYPKGAIELQNHGHPLFFKNVFVREIE